MRQVNFARPFSWFAVMMISQNGGIVGDFVATETRRGTDYEEDPIGKKNAHITTV